MTCDTLDNPSAYRGIQIRRFDVLCTPYVWTHEEKDGHGTAETIEEARGQIDWLLEGTDE